MNIANFLAHWNLVENPFRAEEARHDPVFSRLAPDSASHADFDKIVGDLHRPSTSIVFGEKGSGKTAIRLQLEARVRAHNAANPNARVLLVAYDDLNPMLDRCVAARASQTGEKDPDRATAAALRLARLEDHMDAVLNLAVRVLVPYWLGGGGPAKGGDRAARQAVLALPEAVRADMLALQAIYDEAEGAGERTAALRSRLKLRTDSRGWLWWVGAVGGWVLPAGAVAASLILFPGVAPPQWLVWIFFAALAIWAILILKVASFDAWLHRRAGKRLARAMPALGRGGDSFAASLRHLPGGATGSARPIDDSSEARYGMFSRLRRVLVSQGFSGMLVVIDRVDEPTLINGDADRMRAVVWPMLNAKFLQMEATGFKMLLPVELRFELFRESSGFFQQARLDKQNLVERLAWSGATLYDMCNARLQACRAPAPAGAAPEPLTLTDLFEPDVNRGDLIDALGQMHQPRDAFKLLYQCMNDHCAAVTEDQEAWRIPRHVLETVRKQQVDRVQMLQRGVRPA